MARPKAEDRAKMLIPTLELPTLNSRYWQACIFGEKIHRFPMKTHPSAFLPFPFTVIYGAAERERVTTGSSNVDTSEVYQAGNFHRYVKAREYDEDSGRYLQSEHVYL